MTFCRRKGPGSQQTRIDALAPLWMRLKKASLYPHTKEYILRQAFWPAAFHAIGITLLPWKTVQGLRTQAAKALGHGLAGANPAVRLALLSQDMSADPGFYQLKRVILDFQRFLQRMPAILDSWISYMDHFDGALLSGPFSKLIEQFELIHWTVQEPPWFSDHDDCLHDLQRVSSSTLVSLLQDAWHQRIALEICHRKDFQGLCGLQWPASRHEQRLSALDAARICSVREGAFLSGSTQGRYDLVKGSLCSSCGVVDTMTHRATTCSLFRASQQRHPEACALWHRAPLALSEHLLPSRNPWSSARKRLLMTLPDFTDRFLVTALDDDWHDLFADGSSLWPGIWTLTVSAWAVVSVRHNAVLAAGPTVGLQQDPGRAELTAALASIRWLYVEQTKGTLWLDSAYVASGLHSILETGVSPEYSSNEDLWEEVATFVCLLDRGHFQVQHVAGHRQAQDQEDPVDDWSAHWNTCADGAARAAHGHRSDEFKQVQLRLEHEFFQSENNVDILRAFHLDLAQQAAELGHIDLDEDEQIPLPLLAGPDRPSVDGGDWIDALPLGWLTHWIQEEHKVNVAPAVAARLVDWLQSERSSAECGKFVSWLELAAMLETSVFEHPLQLSVNTRTVWVDAIHVPFSNHQPPTVALRIRFLKDVFKILSSLFGLDIPVVQGLDLSRLGVHPPQTGVTLMISPPVWRSAVQRLRAFTSSRPVRTANDLSRPF